MHFTFPFYAKICIPEIPPSSGQGFFARLCPRVRWGTPGVGVCGNLGGNLSTRKTLETGTKLSQTKGTMKGKTKEKMPHSICDPEIEYSGSFLKQEKKWDGMGGNSTMNGYHLVLCVHSLFFPPS